MAAALQRDGIVRGASIAIVAHPSIDYACVFLGALRAGCVAAPLSPSATATAIAAMIDDCAAPIVFVDAPNAKAIQGAAVEAVQILFGPAFEAWLAPADTVPDPVSTAPGDAFNIIYSSGTTGNPKGIVQSHAMRWQHISRNAAAGFVTR